MTDKERALRHLGITMNGYRTEYGTPILTDVSVKDAIAGVVAAVRAETLREVRGVVDNLTHSRAHPDDYYYSVSICDHSERDGRGGYDVYVERTDLLAALDALAQPEGTE
jgi:hypothetical protein